MAGKKVTVGLTGGIACYKIPYLVRALTGAGVTVQVIMTESACRFITPLTMETVSRRPVAIRMFPSDRYVGTHHIDMAQWPDLIVVAPATANLIGKICAGICDDLLTTVICAAACPVMIAPAMNPAMWENPITRRNVGDLKSLGYLFVGPEEGEMACKEAGVGRMSEPEQLFRAVEAFLCQKKG